MRLGGGPIPRGRASEDRDLMSYRVKQEFLKVITSHTLEKTHGTGIAEVREGRRDGQISKGHSQDVYRS
jgi:hypothetical protein